MSSQGRTQVQNFLSLELLSVSDLLNRGWADSRNQKSLSCRIRKLKYPTEKSNIRDFTAKMLIPIFVFFVFGGKASDILIIRSDNFILRGKLFHILETARNHGL